MWIITHHHTCSTWDRCFTVGPTSTWRAPTAKRTKRSSFQRWRRLVMRIDPGSKVVKLGEFELGMGKSGNINGLRIIYIYIYNYIYIYRCHVALNMFEPYPNDIMETYRLYINIWYHLLSFCISDVKIQAMAWYDLDNHAERHLRTGGRRLSRKHLKWLGKKSGALLHGYPLVNVYITMGNHHVQWGNSLFL